MPTKKERNANLVKRQVYPCQQKKNLQHVESDTSPKKKSNKHKTSAVSPAIPKKKQQKQMTDSSSEDETNSTAHVIIL